MTKVGYLIFKIISIIAVLILITKNVFSNDKKATIDIALLISVLLFITNTK